MVPDAKPPSSRRASRWVRIALVQVAIVVTLTSVGAHLFVAHRNVSAVGDSIWDWNARDGVVVRRDATTRFIRPIRFTVYTDGRGARVVSRASHTPTTVDTMFVGCSFTFGWGVEARETFANVLGERAGARIANLGIPGTNTASMLRAIARNRDLEPRVIVYAFITSHLRRNLSPCAPLPSSECVSVPYVSWRADAATLHAPRGTLAAFERMRSAASLAEENRWIDAPRIAFYIGRSLAHAIVSEEPDPASFDAYGEATLAYLLERMQSLATDMDAELVFLRIPEPSEDLRPMPPSLRARVPAGVTIVDAAELMRARAGATPEVLTLRGDSHPSPLGHALVAEALTEAVAAASSATRARGH